MTTLKKIGEAKRELGIGVLYAGEGGEVVFSGITIPITWPRRLI